MNHSMLAAHTADRIREDIRETSEHVRTVVFGTAIATLFAFANLAGLSKSSRARRTRLRADRQARRAAADAADQTRSRALN